jgi:activator of HSP90 ATPase
MSEQSSYYYFRSTPQEQAEQYKPKPVHTQHNDGDALANGASPWNAAGTWEERDVSTWAEQRIKQLIGSYQFPSLEDGGCVKIKSVKKVEGRASVIYVRGKKKVGYEFRVEVDWEGENASGSIELPDLSDYDTDIDVRHYCLLALN